MGLWMIWASFVGRAGCGARVYAARVAADARLKSAFPDEWLGFALGGGEDYELLFVAPAGVMRRAVGVVRPPPMVVGVITEFADGGSGPRVAVVDGRGNRLDVASGGWDHFRGG